MNNLEALQLLKYALELHNFDASSKFREIYLSVKEYVKEPTINSEIERNNLGQALVLVDKYLFEKSTFKPYYYLGELEQFDFEEQFSLTIDEIKKLLKTDLLQFCLVKDVFGNTLSYCRHWENQRRISVLIERDLMEKLKTDRTILLNLTKQTILANQGYYYKFTIRKYVKPVIYNPEMDDDGGDRNWESDYFDAMTDGQLGTYDDFRDGGGNIDDIDTWSQG